MKKMAIITTIWHRAQFYSTYISNLWYLIMVTNMKKIHLVIIICGGMYKDRLTDWIHSGIPWFCYCRARNNKCIHKWSKCVLFEEYLITIRKHSTYNMFSNTSWKVMFKVVFPLPNIHYHAPLFIPLLFAILNFLKFIQTHHMQSYHYT